MSSTNRFAALAVYEPVSVASCKTLKRRSNKARKGLNPSPAPLGDEKPSSNSVSKHGLEQSPNEALSSEYTARTDLDLPDIEKEAAPTMSSLKENSEPSAGLQEDADTGGADSHSLKLTWQQWAIIEMMRLDGVVDVLCITLVLGSVVVLGQP